MKQSLIKYPNGLKAVVCSKVSNVVTISFSLMFGAEQEKRTQSGITSVIEKLLRLEINKEVAKFGGVVETRTDYEHIEITISTIRENLEASLSILTKVLFDFHPTMVEFNQVRAMSLQTVEKNKSNPLAIISSLTQKNRYKTTSLATELSGTVASLTSITLEDVRNYFAEILVPKYMLLSVVGNISNEAEGLEKQNIDEDETTRILPDEDIQGIKLWDNIKNKLDISKVKDKKYQQDNLDYIKDLLLKEFYSKTLNLKTTVRRRSTAYFPLKESTIIRKNKNLNQTRYQISLASAPYASKGYKYAKLFEIYLRRYLASALRAAQGLYGLDIAMHQFKHNAHLSITFAVDAEYAEATYEKVMELLRSLRAQEISKKEFSSLLTHYETLISLGHEKMSDLAKRYNKWLFLSGELFSINKLLKEIQVLNYNDYLYIADKMLDPKGMLTVVLGKA